MQHWADVKGSFIVMRFNWENICICCIFELCGVSPDTVVQSPAANLPFTQIKTKWGNKWEHVSYQLPALSPFIFVAWSWIAQLVTNLFYSCLPTQSHGGICGEGAKEGYFLFFLTKLPFCFQESCLALLQFCLLTVSHIKYFQKLSTACSASIKRISDSSSV